VILALNAHMQISRGAADLAASRRGRMLKLPLPEGMHLGTFTEVVSSLGVEASLETFGSPMYRFIRSIMP
jgi:hypothetical protein